MSKWLDKQQMMIAEENNIVMVEEEEAPRKYVAGDFHLWKRGDSLVDLAREMRVPLKKLMEYNEIETHQELENDVPVYYPASPHTPERRNQVEVLAQTLHMHVSKPGGAKKWMFGSMETWDDAKAAGFYPQGTNVIIVAIVKVPISDPDDPDAEAAYYIDYNALGDYVTTGILRYTLGFAWSDLDHGHIETLLTKTAPAADPVIPPYLEDEDTDVPISDQDQSDTSEVTEVEREETLPNGLTKDYIDAIMNGYQKLKEVQSCIADIPEDYEGVQIDHQTGKRFIWIHDYARKRQDLPLYNLQDVEIAATFPVDGIEVGRPVESVTSGNMFGIPLSVLQSYDDLYYNEPMDATTRAEAGLSLTWSERYVWIPLNRFLQKFAPGYLKKINKKEKNS